MPWDDVGGALPGMVAKTAEFQAACAKMPKELRLWDAYVELRQIIDEIATSLPLLTALSHPSMRSRHWALLMEATGESLPVGTPEFRLVSVLHAKLPPPVRVCRRATWRPTCLASLPATYQHARPPGR